MTPRRERWLGVGLLVAGAALLLLAAGQPWVSARVPADPPLPGRTVTLPGRVLAPAAAAVGWAVLAAAAALVLARRWARFALGLLVIGLGLLAGYDALDGASGSHVRDALQPAVSSVSSVSSSGTAASYARTAWPSLAIAAAAVVTAAGVLVVVLAPRWPHSAQRFERGPDQVDPQRSSWEALDRGEDPTLGER